MLLLFGFPESLPLQQQHPSLPTYKAPQKEVTHPYTNRRTLMSQQEQQETISRIFSETDDIPATEVADVLHRHAGWDREATVSPSALRTEWNQCGSLPRWAKRLVTAEIRSRRVIQTPSVGRIRACSRSPRFRRCAKRFVLSKSAESPAHIATFNRCAGRRHT